MSSPAKSLERRRNAVPHMIYLRYIFHLFRELEVQKLCRKYGSRIESIDQDLLGQNDVECGCGCQMKKIAHRNESSQATAAQGADSSPLCSADRRCAASHSADQHSERFDQDVPPRSRGRTCLPRASAPLCCIHVFPLFRRFFTRFYFSRSIEFPLSPCAIRKCESSFF